MKGCRRIHSKTFNEYALIPVSCIGISADFFGEQKFDKKTNEPKDEASARKTIMGIRKRISHLIDEGKGIHSGTSKLVQNVFRAFTKGKNSNDRLVTQGQ